MHDLCSVTYATVTCLGPELMMKEIMRQYLSPQISLSQSMRAATSSQRFPAQCQKAAPINTMHSSSKIIWVPLTLLLFIRSCSSTNIICAKNPVVVRGQKICWSLEETKVYWKSQARSSCSKKSKLPDGFQGRVFAGKVREKVQYRWSPPSLFSDWLMMR